MGDLASQLTSTAAQRSLRLRMLLCIADFAEWMGGARVCGHSCTRLLRFYDRRLQGAPRLHGQPVRSSFCNAPSVGRQHRRRHLCLGLEAEHSP